LKTIFRLVSSARARRNYFLALPVLVAVFTLAACNDPDQLGLDILPPGDHLQVNFTDTANVTTLSQHGDSVVTNKNFLTYLLGSYTDPLFGRSDASVYAQVGMPFLPNLGDSTEILTADSLVLTLQYYGSWYGNKSTPLKLTVYRLTESMSPDSIYFTNRDFSTEAQPVGSVTFIPQPSDSVPVYGVNTAPHLRIRLSDALADELLSLNGTPTYASNTAWLSYFKGLFVKAEPVTAVNEGSLVHFYLLGFQSGMRLYYHSDTPGDDSASYVFAFNGAITNRFAHDYGRSDAGRQIQDASYNDSLGYVQAMGGVRAKIDFPHLTDFFSSGPLEINKAELILPVQSGETEQYPLPGQMQLQAVDSAGAAVSVSDYVTDAPYFGGTYNSSEKTYTFTVSRELQLVAKGLKEFHGFYVIVPYITTLLGYPIVQPGRVVLSGAANQTRPVQLRITYTELN
jgi:hypothetical protein